MMPTVFSVIEPSQAFLYMDDLIVIGFLPDSKKYDVIKKYPVPTDADSARRFVAF